MINYKEKAVELFRQGFNCSQAVLGAFNDILNIDLKTSYKISSSFGGGMGRLREVCGAVSSMFMFAGLKYGYVNPKDKEAKNVHYKLIQSLAADFKDIHSSIICRELLNEKKEDNTFIPESRTEEYYAMRPCEKCVYNAAKILCSILEITDVYAVAVKDRLIADNLNCADFIYIYSVSDKRIVMCKSYFFDKTNLNDILDNNKVNYFMINDKDHLELDNSDVKVITGLSGPAFKTLRNFISNM